MVRSVSCSQNLSTVTATPLFVAQKGGFYYFRMWKESTNIYGATLLIHDSGALRNDVTLKGSTVSFGQLLGYCKGCDVDWLKLNCCSMMGHVGNPVTYLLCKFGREKPNNIFSKKMLPFCKNIMKKFSQFYWKLCRDLLKPRAVFQRWSLHT